MVYKIKKTKYIISSGKLKVISAENSIKLLWDGVEITQGLGLNVSVNTLGIWTDSSLGDWNILSKNTDSFTVKITFRDLPLSQVWKIYADSEYQLRWKVSMVVEECLHIDEVRINCFTNSCYKTWVNGYRQGDFPRLGNDWLAVYYDDNKSSLVGVRFPVKEGFLSGLAVALSDEDNSGFLSIIQNSPLRINAHVISLRRIDIEDRKDYYPGEYALFDGRIMLCDDSYQLDREIENLRRKAMDNSIAKNSPGKGLTRRTKVSLVNLPWQRKGKWGVRAGSRWPHIKDESEKNYLPFPFFLAYAASLLEKHGIDAFVIDAIAEQIPEDKFMKKILAMDVDYLVVENSTASFYDDLSILKKISKAGISIIICGPNYEIYDAEFLRRYHFIDFVLYGEYELSLLELIESLQDNKDLAAVKGLIYRFNNKVIKTPKREPFDINLLPWPYRDNLPMNRYCDIPGDMPAPSVQMLSSRGCPFNCNFCLWPQVIYQGNHYRLRNIDDVVNEMQHLIREKEFRSIYFDDDTFNIDKKRMLEFSQAIKKRGLQNIPWAIMARADLMDEEILVELKSAGLWAVKYGVESSNKDLIKSCNKDLNLDKTTKIIQLTRDLGIRTHLSFCFGFPQETKKTIQKTIDYALGLKPYSLQFSILTPFPGTRLFEELDKQGRILTRDWSKYDGHSNCVFKPDNLRPKELVAAKIKAYRLWGECLRKKRSFWEDVKVFKKNLEEGGFRRALYKTAVATKDNTHSIFKVSKHILRNYPDLLGVFNGRYAFKGPAYVQIDLTNNCNNNCIACWCNSPLLKEKAMPYDIKRQALPFELVKNLLDELHTIGTKDIYFSGGGEPFMHPQIMQILEYAKKSGFTCLVNTNFTLLDKEKIKKLVNLGVDHLTVSTWAATAGTYASTHPNKNEDTFRQIVENLRFLNQIKQKTPHITLYNVISSINCHELKGMIALAKDTGSESAEFTLIDTIPGKTDKLILNPEQIEEVERQAKEIAQGMDTNGYFDGIEVCRFDSFLRRISSSPDLARATYDRNIIDSMPCCIGWCFSRIMANGDVNACLKAHRIPVGNLYQQSFHRIWNGKKQRNFRKKTLVYEKKDPFFRLIGNDPDIKESGCYKSCDDISRNIDIHNRIISLTTFEHKVAKVLSRILR